MLMISVDLMYSLSNPFISYHTRRNSVQSTFGVVVVYMVYGTVLCVLYATLNEAVGNDYHDKTDGDSRKSARTMEGVLAYLVGAR